MHEHIEHAEHAGHGTPDPFTLRVAMTMAIIAAVLAAISLVGHRKHNDNLRLIGDANRLRTEAAAHKVEASNLFAWYQSKRLRVELARNSIDYANLFAPAAESEARRGQKVKEWEAYAAKNDPPKGSVVFEGMPEESDDRLPALQVRGNNERRLADEKEAQAKKIVHEAEHTHHQSDWLDVAHLAVEVGLVFCTIAVLTKRREFWLTGILAAVVGIGLSGYGLLFVH